MTPISLRIRLLQLPVLKVQDVMNAFNIKQRAAYDLMNAAGASKTKGAGLVVTSDQLKEYIESQRKVSKKELQIQADQMAFNNRRKK